MIIARDWVSKIRGMLKLTSADFIISDRMILQELLQVNVKLVVQALNKRQNSNSPNLFTNIPCLEMIKVPLASCCDYQGECEITRSKEKLPAIVDTYYNLAISFVASIDKKVKFNELETPQRLVNLMKIYPKKPLGTYYWIMDNYLYTTSPDLELVTISAFFRDLIDPNDYTCSKDQNTCPTNPMLLPIKSLPKLEEDITNIAAQQIANTYLKVSEQRSSDNMEGN